jgi:hypothetical protein
MKNRIKIKLNQDLNGHKKNSVLELSCDDDGIPYNSFWRRRLIDADYDNCVEILPEQEAKPVEKIKNPKVAGDQ